jgi:hypothetical protein
MPAVIADGFMMGEEGRHNEKDEGCHASGMKVQVCYRLAHVSIFFSLRWP